MMIDRYTKVVLTVIACALVAIAAQSLITSVRAQQEIQKVQICNAEGCVGMMARRAPSSGSRPGEMIGWSLATSPDNAR
jgi:hypothetical protein